MNSTMWQPIETAPKDGTPILIFSAERCTSCPPKTAGMGTAYWCGGYWGITNQFYPLRHKPTHWMPLPEPPQTRISGDRTEQVEGEIETK